MKISSILKELQINYSFLNNEIEVDTLGLTASNINDSFCTFIDNKKFIKQIPNSVKLLLVSPELSKENFDSICICIVDKPRETFFRIHNYLQSDLLYSRPNFKTKFGNNCMIDDKAIIANNNVIIGDNVTIEPHAIINSNTLIGNNCIIRSGVIIGGEGFEFKRTQSKILSVKHLGGVIISDNVEIQYHTCIDKAVFPWDNTTIGEYSKLDNLIQVGHAVKIGERCLVAGQTVIGGRTIIGNDSWIGPGVTISNGLKVGDNSSVSIGSVVVSNVNARTSVAGNFAIDKKKFIKHIKKIEIT